ncbi:TadE/TadG family type IV pilus assembly protein [Streptomyces sp. NPDC048002]|uniref:TadE/TadG family type IV pilus assembly protein n=1 Tax=Streptomyces sp. NPDC048002 TaxID=3154344 RepID=UPI0033D0FF50
MPYDLGRRARAGIRWAGAGSRRAPAGSRRDRGQVALEYLGFIPVLVLVALAAVQIGLIAYTAQQAGTAARAGARSASLDGPFAADCQAAVSGWLADGTGCTSAGLGDEVRVTATVVIPSVVPGWDFGDATKSATMPLDH